MPRKGHVGFTTTALEFCFALEARCFPGVHTPRNTTGLSGMTQRSQQQNLQGAIFCWQCWGHQEGLASATAPRASGTSSTASCGNQEPRFAQALWHHHCACPWHSHHWTGLTFAPWGQQDQAGCAPLAWGTQPVPELRQQLGRHAAAETHAARRAGGTGVRSGPDPPLFSQGLHFQRSPWDSTPSPIPTRQGK